MKIKFPNKLNVFKSVSNSEIQRDVVKVIQGRKFDVKYENWTMGGDTALIKCYYTKDGQYINDVTKRVIDAYGVEPEFSGGPSIGFSPRDGKYYGWSHRACWGFKPGDQIKKGDCAYKPLNDKQSILESVRDFWPEDYHIVELEGDNIAHWSPDYDKLRAKYGPNFFHKWTNKDWVNEFGHQSQKVTWQILKQKGYMTKDVQPISDIPTGKGEWTLRNTDDAKQAAIDFAQSVSKVS